MSYTYEHNRMSSELAKKASQWDMATDPSPEALYEALTAGINIWCTPEDHLQGWDGVPLIAGAFVKPCGCVGTGKWK